LNNNAFRLGVAAAGLSLFWAPSAQAVAPVVSDIPDVVISDSEDNIGGTDNNYFVFTNAFQFDNFVTDGDTPVNTLKWSFDEGTDVNGDSSTQYFTINNKNPNAVGDAAIAAAQANPATRLNPANDLRTSPTASFRDVVLTPGSGPLVSAFPTAAPSVRNAHAAGKVVRLYVSDQTFVVSTDIIVSAVDSDTTPSVDALSGGFAVLKTDAFTTSSGWGALGQVGTNFTAAIGTRQFDPVNTALAATVTGSNRYAIIGWIEDAASDVPFSDIGTGKFVRGKFSIFYSGAGDSASPTLANLVPNFRMGLRTKGAVNTVLEINHNAETAGSIAQFPTTRELGPSKNPALPSVYRVDLAPLAVPFLTNSTTEGVQRAFETLHSVGNASFVVGTLSLTDSSIGSYPALSDGPTPIAALNTGGAPNAADFDNAGIPTSGQNVNVATLINVTDPNGPPASYWNPTSLTVNLGFLSGASITKSPSGITVNTTGLSTASAQVLDAPIPGPFGQTNATRARISADKIYKISFRLKHNGASDTTPFVRFNARTVGFGYNTTFELLGGRGLAGDGLAALAQVMPGTGNQVPGTTIDGTTYNLLLNSPLSADIRADVSGSLATKFPTLAAQPGPGVNAASLRDLNYGFTVVDSLSFASPTATNAAEVANGLTLNLIEVREYDQVND
jgi:hypothetical protein